MRPGAEGITDEIKFQGSEDEYEDEYRIVTDTLCRCVAVLEQILDYIGSEGANDHAMVKIIVDNEFLFRNLLDLIREELARIREIRMVSREELLAAALRAILQEFPVSLRWWDRRVARRKLDDIEEIAKVALGRGSDE